MPIDASIIGKLQTPQIDPLGTISKAQGLAGQMLQNRMLSQEVQGKEALGRAVTANTNSDTGDTDWNKAAGALSQDPQGAWKLPEFAGQILDRKAKEIANATAKANLTQAQLETSQKKFAALGDWAGTMAAAGSKDQQALTPQAILSSAKSNLIDTGMINPADPQERDQLLSIMSQFGNDPAKNAELLKHVFLQSHTTAEGVGLALGNTSMVDVGSRLQPMRTPGLTGVPEQVGAPIEKTLSPSESAALVDVVDPASGTHYKVPRAALGGLPGQPSAAPAAGTGTGRYPGAAGTGAPAGAVAAASLPPGKAEALSVSAQQSAGTWQRDLAEAGGYAQRVQGLDKAYENLQKATTGPGAGKVQGWAGVLNTFGVKTPTDVNSYAEAQKYLQDYANRRGAELGMGTDAGRALVNAANPGVQTPKQAALQVVTVIKGLEKMQAAQVAAAQAENVSPDQYASWRAKWNRSVDPGAFVPPKLDGQKGEGGPLTKEQWETKRKQMGERWAAYKRGIDAGLAAGVLTPSELRK